MTVKTMILWALAAPVLLAGVAIAAEPNAPLFDTIERGGWEFRAVGGGARDAGVGRVCVGDPNKLIQLQHQNLVCRHYVVSSTPSALTVSYSCPGGQQGRTSIRRETGRLLQIQSQGIKDGSPFEINVEARRVGAC